MTYIEEYMDAIRAGEAVVGRRVRKVYEQLEGEVLEPSGQWIYDDRKGRRPVDFIERYCCHSKGEWAGTPVKLELFQKAYVSALFGFVDRNTGGRRFKETLFYVARKNGKSTLAAGIALYCLLADGEAGAEVYSVATKKDQAKIIYDEACNMVAQSPELKEVLRKRKADLYFAGGLAKMAPLGRIADTLDGLNAHLVIIDELHGIKDRGLYEVMKQSQSARRQPLLVMTTTAGTVRECIFDDMHKYAEGVADGSIRDERFLPVLYELDAREEWQDPRAWRKANPGLGPIKKPEDIIEKVERARQDPANLAGILCKDFNVISSSRSAWLSWDDIENRATFSLEDFRGKYFIGGVDLSHVGDLTCATALLMDRGETRYVYQCYWLPRETFDQRIREEKIPYDRWRDQGLLRLCDGNQINYHDVTQWFLELVRVHGLSPAWIYYDPWGADYFTKEMEAEGFPMVSCRQGVKTLSLPMQKLGADLAAKKVNYNDSGILKWCLANTGVKTDVNGNIQPIKSQGSKYRMDGMASLLDAYVGLTEHYQEYLDTL